MKDNETKTTIRPEKIILEDLKSFDEMKEELGKKYDELMYDMNKELLLKINEYEISNYDLQSQLTQANSKIEKIKELCRKIKGQSDFGSWVDLKESWETLEGFNEDIERNLHPMLTTAYQCEIKNSIKKVIEYGRYQAVKKEDILSIIGEK